MFHIGFLVNPFAGMGGAVGLKGTDDRIDEAVRRGAVPRAQERAVAALSLLRGSDLHFLTCSGAMGENALNLSGINQYSVVYESPARSTAVDTRNACREFLEQGTDLILFCGGDGTARDVFDLAGRKVPMLGIPAGVKMYSGVFAVNPAAAAGVLREMPEVPLRDAEVMDVDEEAYRRGDLKTRLYGYARTPYLPEKVAGSKQVFEEQDEERAKEEIARFIGEVMAGTPGTLTILGPGTTTGRIASYFGIEKTLLGFDAVREGKITARDLDEQGLLTLLNGTRDVRLVISPIGAQGFVLGHGTQAVSPAVIRQIGIKNIIVVASPYKLSQTPTLFVDTGDPELDREFPESIPVISGYRIAQRKRIAHTEMQ
jgi:predicted polyphosphate/ATP-dependent NAD kinase